MILNFCKICLKRVSIINLALLFVGETYACGWEPHHSPSRYPAFQFINTPLVRNYYEKETNWETIRYWYNYADGKIGMNEISDFINTATYADVKDRRDKNPFFRYLVEHNDTAAIRFLSESLDFSEALANYYQNVWEYRKPSESGLSEIVDRLSIPSENNPMFERYVFLDIRANAAMHRYDKVIELWNRYNKMIKNENLRERMLGYLGGAYYHTKNYVDAISIFSNNGDVNSLNWCLARLVGIDNMIRLFNENPNSDAVYYVLQDYMNYLWLLKLNQAQEFNFAFPGNPYRNGAYDVEGDLTRECRRLIAVADMAVADARVEYPAVWATAKAFALNLLNDGKASKKVISEALRLRGTVAMKNNLERIDFWIDFSNYTEDGGSDVARLAERYNTLFVKAKNQAAMAASVSYDEFFSYPEDIADYVFLADFMIPYAAIQYRNTSLYYRVLAMMSGVKAINSKQDYIAFEPAYRSTPELQWRGLSMMVEKLDNPDSLSDIDKAIFSSASINPNPYYDALGRVELSKGNYGEAIKYFDRLDRYWIGRQGYFVYLQTRYDERFVPFSRTHRGWESIDSVSFVDTENYRADYCRKLLALKQRYDNASENGKAVAGYEYAQALFLASAQGDLWAVSNNMWSFYEQVDSLSEMSVRVLVEACKFAADADVKARILYGIAAVKTNVDQPSYAWNRLDWSSFSDTQLNAYYELSKLYNKIEDPRIKGCDILKAYITEKRIR